MPVDAFKFKIFSRRVFIISALQGFAFILILLRLFKFQVLDYQHFKDKSDKNRIKTTIIPPFRGLISDRNNKIIASNVEYYRIILKKTNYRADLEIIQKLSKILGFKEEGFKALRQEYFKNRQSKEVVIYRYLTRKELLNVEFNLHLLKNIFVGIGYARVYSNSFSFSNLLGYLIQVPKSEMNKYFIQDPDIKIGAEGLEKIHNISLMGRAGVKYSEVNVKGIKITDLKTVPPINGTDLKFSFNSILQNFAFEICKEKKASVVLMDIETGELLIMLSTPSFDANLLSKKIDTNTWESFLHNPKKPLLNRPIQSAFAPGSLFKPITAIVGLENGMTGQEKVNCMGETSIFGVKKRCWLKGGHGKNIDLGKAIKHSCNMMFYGIGAKYDVDLFHKVAKEFGIGEVFSHFSFDNQNTGINPSKSWKKSALKEVWFPGDTVNLAIGQGFIKMTALQITVMMARIASLGKKIEPTLDFISNPLDLKFDDININKNHIKFVKSALFEATNSMGGTSYFSRIREKGLEFSGKTGTAQVVSKFLEKHEYTENTRPHGLFTGFAPFENSKFCIAVVVENGGFGSSVAAPIGKNVLYFAQLLHLNRIEDAKKLAHSLKIDFNKL